MRIVFDTQAMCVSTFIIHTPSLTVDGYRFRYLRFVNSQTFCKFVATDTQICMMGDDFFKKENPVRWLFEQFPEFNASQIAKAMGINETLFRNYINGSKRPSAERILDIENFLHKLAKELSETRLL